MNRKRILLLVTTTAALLGAPRAAFPAAPTDPFIAAIAAMKRSVAPVICVKPHKEDEPFSPIVDGTAFFISKQGEFLTAAHVMRDFTAGHGLQGCQMSIWFSTGSSTPGRIDFQFIPVRRCVADYNADIARCATADDLSAFEKGKFAPVPLEIEAQRRSDGSPIAVTGYPLSSLLPITSRGYIGGYQGEVSGISQMVLDRAAWPGGSGSPVYDGRRKALGIVTQAGEGAASGISFARSGATIVSFLAAHPLPPQKP